jgi:hypothetical protein
MDTTQRTPRVRDNEWTVGVLIDHGPAPFRFEKDNYPTYFARILVRESDDQAKRAQAVMDDVRRPGIDGRSTTSRGWSPNQVMQTLWGTDLKRAIEESKSHAKVGEQVAARILKREPVDVPGVGKTYNNIWEVETPAFVNQRQATAKRILEDVVAARQAGKAHPALAGIYLMIRGAEEVARHNFGDSQDQKRFVDQVRHVLFRAIERNGLSHAIEPPASGAPTNERIDSLPRVPER